MKAKNKDLIMHNQVFTWIALATGIVLSIPLVAMQFTSEVDWTLFDFVVGGALLFGAGSQFVMIARSTPRKYRMVVGLAVLIAALLLYVHLAVGIVDTWPLAGS